VPRLYALALALALTHAVALALALALAIIAVSARLLVVCGGGFSSLPTNERGHMRYQRRGQRRALHSDRFAGTAGNSLLLQHGERL